MSPGIPPPDSLGFPGCASFTSPSSPPPIGAQGSVMQTTFCQIKFEWIGGMTTIPSEWICKGLSSFLAHVPASRGATTQDGVPIQLLLHISAITDEIFCIPAVHFIHNMIGYIQWRSGRLTSNLVTSTSGLNEVCAK